MVAGTSVPVCVLCIFFIHTYAQNKHTRICSAQLGIHALYHVSKKVGTLEQLEKWPLQFAFFGRLAYSKHIATPPALRCKIPSGGSKGCHKPFEKNSRPPPVLCWRVTTPSSGQPFTTPFKYIYNAIAQVRILYV